MKDTNKNTFIFDMDGVIIDSESFWRQAQKEVLCKWNITITEEDCIQHTMGKRIDDIALIWCSLFDLKTDPKSLEKDIIKSVVSLINENGKAKKGLYELLDYLKTNNFKIGLATSSSLPIIHSVFKKLAIESYFNVVCSADEEVYGKPHPAVYLKAAELLKAKPANCIVLEDSITGLISGKAASMHTLVIPEEKTDPRFLISNGIFSSMLEVVDYLRTKNF
ncbi:hexitol phosphatase HxpB [Mariniflexile sp.]|uniref:hexitol phosphatase HxpB n=1 Tax=Mariniflexile sp. TaxID=1979402 RepID=UPI003565526C